MKPTYFSPRMASACLRDRCAAAMAALLTAALFLLTSCRKEEPQPSSDVDDEAGALELQIDTEWRDTTYIHYP